jgi:hypothetical protein
MEPILLDPSLAMNTDIQGRRQHSELLKHTPETEALQKQKQPVPWVPRNCPHAFPCPLSQFSAHQ